MVTKPKSNRFNDRARGLTVIPECYQDIEAWPAFDEERISNKARRERYRRLRKAVELYLSKQASMNEVASVAKITARRFRRILHRCFEPRMDGTTIMGWEALVERRRGSPIRRTRDFSYQSSPRAGYTGCFRKLLRERPTIEAALTNVLLGIGRRAVEPNRLTMRSIVAAFIRICENEGIRNDEYPLSTVEKGRRAIKRWIDEVFIPAHGLRWINRQHGKDAASAAGYERGDGQSTQMAGPYEGWVIDEVTVDLHARYEIPNATGEWEQLDLSRFTVIRAIDLNTGTNIGWLQVLARQASGEDISQLLWKCINGSPKRPLRVKGLAYMDGAGFPASEIPDLRFAMFRIVYLDNALAHLADIVQHILQHTGGGVVQLGKPATPKERASVESRFAQQARRLLHQLPGTTGSGPHDPVRKAARAPVECRVRADELEDVLEVYIANENILPQAASGYKPPLERLRQQLASKALAPIYLPVDKRRRNFFCKPISVTVRMQLERGRRPFINYLGVRYSSEQLQRALSLKGQTMYIRPDVSDLRSVLLFHEDGALYGPLHALGRWSKFPHDVRIRKMWLRAKRVGELGPRADDAPLEVLFSHFRANAPRDRNSALKLAYLIEYLRGRVGELEPLLISDVDDWVAAEEAADRLTVLPATSEIVSEEEGRGAQSAAARDAPSEPFVNKESGGHVRPFAPLTSPAAIRHPKTGVLRRSLRR